MFGKGGLALWSKELSRIVFEGVSLPGNCFTPSATCWLPDRWTVTFWLTNRISTSVGQSLPSITAASGFTKGDVTGFDVRQIGGVPLNRATRAPRFESASITQDSLIQGSSVNLTLSFKVSVNLPGFAATQYSSTILLSGLINTVTPDNAALPIYGANAALFAGSNGRWNQKAGSLLLTVAEGNFVVADYNVQISILLRNSMQTQPAAAPRISAHLRYPPAEQVSIVSVAPLQLPEMLVAGSGILTASTRSTMSKKIIHEATQVNHAINTITITLQANIPLPIGAVITLIGFLTVTDFPTQVIPLKGPSAALFEAADPAPRIPSAADFNKHVLSEITTIRLTLRSAVEASRDLVIAFVLQNRMCNGLCPGLAISVSAGGAAVPHIRIPLVTMDSAASGVLGAGASLSWITKNVWEATNVPSASNSIIIQFHVNAPLYEGTQILVSGLVSTVYETCLDCYNGNWALGSGCASMCQQCPETEGDAMQGACVPVLHDEYSNPHPLFVDSLGKWQPNGDLILTVKMGAKIEASRPFALIFKMRNRLYAEPRKECWKFGAASSCLQAQIRSGQLCTQVRPLPAEWDAAESCLLGSWAEPPIASVNSNSPVMTQYRQPLLDKCATCLRMADVFALHTVLLRQQTLILTEIAAGPASTKGLPLYRPGALVPGNYTIFLDLTNWLQKTTRERHEFSKDLGQEGQTRTEDFKPTIYIQGLGSLSGMQAASDRDLSLYALARAAACLPNAPRQVLKYTWTIKCTLGACGLTQPLSNLVLSANTRSLHLPAYSLQAGTRYTFSVEAEQSSIVQSSNSQLSLRVPVRPLVVDIRGANQDGTVGRQAGQAVPLHLVISDPEVRTSGMKTSKGFIVSWACAVQADTGPCPPVPAVCRPAPYVPCPTGTLQIAERPCNEVDPNCEHRAALYNLEIGKHYRINTNATRDMFQLPAAIFNRFAAVYVMPVLWTQTVRKTSTFQVVEGIPFPISIFVCPLMTLGTEEVCTNPGPTIVNPHDILALKATIDRTMSSAVQIKLFEWVVENPADANSGILNTANVLTNLQDSFSAFLVLCGGVLTAGHTIRLRLRATSIFDDVATARISIGVRVPPVGGDLTVSPSRGIGMQSTFELVAASWGTDEDNFPLTFTFTSREEGGEADLDVHVWSSAVFAVSSLLPASQSPTNRRVVLVRVSDIFGAFSDASALVTIESPTSSPLALELLPHLNHLLLTRVDAMFRIGDMHNAMGLVGLIAEALNADTACLQTQGVGASCLTGDRTSRQVFRARLLLTVQAANNSLVPTPSALGIQVSVFHKILQVPAEINFETAQLATELLGNSVQAIRHQIAKSRINVGPLAYVHGHCNSLLLQSLAFHSMLLLGTSSMLPSTATTTMEETKDKSSEARRRNSEMHFPTLLLSHSTNRAKIRASLNLENLRSLRLRLKQKALAAISSLSLAQTEPGSTPVVLRLPACTVNTSHVSRQQIELTGWTAQSNTSQYTAFLPASTMAENVVGAMPSTFEIMHVFWDETFEAQLELPESYGPLLALQLRRKGSDMPIKFVEPLKRATWQIGFPVTKTVPEQRDETLGTRMIPFGAWFDADGKNWFWNTDEMLLRTRPDVSSNIMVMQVHPETLRPT